MATYEAPALPINPPVTEEEANSCQLVVLFDLETTSLDTKTTEICQISAFTPSVDSEPWSVYVLPTRGINPGASAVNHLTVEVNGGERVLMKDDAAVETVTIEREALQLFLAYLSNSRRPPQSDILLVAHNALNFDAPILVRAIERNGIPHQSLQNIVFADSLPLFRNLSNTSPKLQELQKFQGKRKKNSLTELYRALFNDTVPSNDATKKMKAFYKILFQSQLQLDIKLPDDLSPYSFQLQKIPLESGLDYKYLRYTYWFTGADGLARALKEPRHNGEPQVTDDQQKIDHIVDHLTVSFEKEQFLEARP